MYSWLLTRIVVCDIIIHQSRAFLAVEASIAKKIRRPE
jgi:hypothetical protein